MGEGVKDRVSGRLLATMMVAMVGCAATPNTSDVNSAPQSPDGAEREAVVATLSAELQRSMERLRLADYEGPYFLSYQLKDDETVTIGGKFGALTSEASSRELCAYVERPL